MSEFSWQRRADGTIDRLTWRGTELLRTLGFVVRQPNWATPHAVAEVRDVDGGLDVHARVEAAGIDLSWLTIIRTGPDWLEATFTAIAHGPTRAHRVGLVALVPLSFAGAPVTVTHQDLSTTKSTFPPLVTPGVLFERVQAISWQVDPAHSMTLRLDGCDYETEDQRNDAEASYKIYAHTGMLQVDAGWTTTQRLRLEVHKRSGSALRQVAAEPRIATLTGDALKKPAIGTMIGPALDESLLHVPRDVAFDHVRVELDLSEEADWSLLEPAMSTGVPLEVALVCRGPNDRLEELAARLVSARVTAVGVFTAGRPVARRRDVRRVRESLAALVQAKRPRVIVGTDINLVDITTNPFSVAALGGDLVGIGMNSQMHDADDEAVLSACEAVPAVIAAARKAGQCDRVAVSPLTLTPRLRQPFRLPAPVGVDLRQFSDTGASWLVSMASTLIAAGVQRLTVAELCGPRGLFGWNGDASPMGKALFDLSLADKVLAVSRQGTRYAVLALGFPDRRVVWLANQSRSPMPITLIDGDDRYDLTVNPLGTWRLSLGPKG